MGVGEWGCLHYVLIRLHHLMILHYEPIWIISQYVFIMRRIKSIEKLDEHSELLRELTVISKENNQILRKLVEDRNIHTGLKP